MKYSTSMKGRQFGDWTVIGPVDKKDVLYNNFRVKCQCKCGTRREVLWRSLVTETSTGCGCKRDYGLIMLPIGGKFGKWQVTGKTYAKNGRSFTPCICECGTKRDVETYSLRKEKSMSCGCLLSKGELIIKNYLLNRGVEFVPQFSFEDCRSPKGRKLKFDFAIFANGDLFGVVEFQGSQHDKIKQDYLVKNQIRHLYISYIDMRNISVLLDKFLD